MSITIQTKEMIHLPYNNRLDFINKWDLYYISFFDHLKFLPSDLPYALIHSTKNKQTVVYHFKQSRFLNGFYDFQDFLFTLASNDNLSAIFDSYNSYSTFLNAARYLGKYQFDNFDFFRNPNAKSVDSYKHNPSFSNNALAITNSINLDPFSYFNQYEESKPDDRFIYQAFSRFNGSRKSSYYLNPKYNITKKDFVVFYDFYGTTIRPVIKIFLLSDDKKYLPLDVQISQPDLFHNVFSYDFKHYHPSLISELISYEVKGDFYRFIDPNENRDTIKLAVFRVLYGAESNYDDKFSNYDFFKKVSQLKHEIYSSIMDLGYYECKFSNGSFKYYPNEKGELRNTFNYFIQYFETYRNAKILNQIPVASDLIVYKYDEFLFSKQINETLLHLPGPNYNIRFF